MLKVIAMEHGLVVQSGPFRGMQCLPEILSSEDFVQHALLPKILGCYEAEVHSVLTEALARGYGKIVNVGCSEGYYSIGLALRLPQARVLAFDLDPGARRLCERMARLNGVADRVTVEGECTTERLGALVTGSTLLVCDCEGCELELLRPDLVPGLATCDVMVELHDWADPNMSRIIPARFAPTHEVTLLTATARDPSAYPALRQFRAYEQRLAVAERRWGAPPVWAFMASRSNQPV
jgi:hypothetical protein